jgi:hypothetical protein
MVLQIDERRLVVAAPGPEPTEVLIEEVREQARRRHRRNLALVLMMVVLGSTAYFAISGGNASLPRSPSTGYAEPGIPSSLIAAIDKTLGVRSVEIVTNYQPSPAIYQAPDLYAAPEDVDLKTARDAFYVSGTKMYWANSIGRLHEFPNTQPKVDGLVPAKRYAFGELVTYLRTGTDFTRVATDVYTFRSHTTVDGVDVPHYASGKILLSNGYVVGLTVIVPPSDITSDNYGPGAIGIFATRYERIDHNPHLVAPGFRLSLCRPTGSLVLHRCPSLPFV